MNTVPIVSLGSNIIPVPIVAWRGPSGPSGSFSFSSINGEGFTTQIGQPIKSSVNYYYLAQGDSILNIAVAVASSDTGAGEIGTGIVSGPITRSDWTPVTGTTLLVPGASYFLTTNVHGSLTNIPPTSTGPGTVNQVIGWAVSENTLVVNISRPIIL